MAGAKTTVDIEMLVFADANSGSVRTGLAMRRLRIGMRAVSWVRPGSTGARAIRIR